MTQTKKLQSKMKEHGFTIFSLAKELGISDTCLFNKIHNKTEFLVSEFEKIGKLLELTCDEKEKIFFAKM